MDDQSGDTLLSPSRARRVTTKAVNYAKEQEFSDAEDLFEGDSDDDVKPRRGAAVRTKPSSSRSSAGGNARDRTSIDHRGGGGHLHQVDDDDHQMDQSQRPIYTEKGYDANLPSIRERFSFLPEYEEDGSPKIELIVGRRAVDDTEEIRAQQSNDDEDDDDEAGDEDDNGDVQRNGRSRRRTATPSKSKKKRGDDEAPTKKKGGTPEATSSDLLVEYEYLVKFKGKSYLHLEWKKGADLESMNKSAKGIYRRYVKKLIAPGIDMEELESPEFDPSYVIPEKILDEADQEVTEELSDKELLKWEQQRAKELEKLDDSQDDDEETPTPSKTIENATDLKFVGDKKDEQTHEDWPDGMDYKSAPVDHLRRILNKEGTYYPILEGCDNPYRDGYVTEPPKKPRASYLLFQATVRSYMGKLHPKLPQAELMVILGEAWRAMDDNEKAPWFQLADEELKQHNKEKILLEKAQKPNGVWQPFRRCLQVLNRLSNDSFADIFLEPVNTDDFPDYDDIIDSRMDLGTVRKRLEVRKYQGPEQFARDMRRIWNNCKIYNQHGSAIWHVADYMSKQFERLYHAWVLEFREKYFRWADPRARPWEYSCRVHDGKCGTPDDKMVLCDHCDGMYGFQCIAPPLSKVPTKAWHCPDCRSKLKSTKGVRMLSAVAENAARKRAELGDVPKKKITQIMFLVKWAGLGYEFCTWETKSDISNDSLIADFNKINHGGFSDEADLAVEQITDFFQEIKHVNVVNAGGMGAVPLLRSQLYSQCRGMEFLKYGLALPDSIKNEIGPMTDAANRSLMVAMRYDDDDENMETEQKHPREVLECLYDIVFKVARQQRPHPIRSNTFLPPPLSGEYDTIVPITAKGLMMNVGEMHGAVAFLGYRQFADGTKGPAELGGVVRNVGDKIIAVDGISTVGKSFQDVINLLRESGKNKYAYMRLLEARYSACDCNLSSAGAVGGYAYEELNKKFMTDRQRVLVQRKCRQVDDRELSGKTTNKDDGEDESEAGSEGSFEPDSEDEELIGTVGVREVSPSTKKDNTSESGECLLTTASVPLEEDMSSDIAPVHESGANKLSNEVVTSGVDSKNMAEATFLLHREETSRSLALRLLDVDLGYSSDEAGDENCAYFIDGVDETFTNVSELQEVYAKTGKIQKSDFTDIVPANKTEFSAMGGRGKLVAAVALSTRAPTTRAYDNLNVTEKNDEIDAVSNSKHTKRSTVKIEQVDLSTDECLHVWANVEVVAATLQLPLPALRQVLRGEYDEEIGEEVGGFRWRYAASGAKVTAGLSQSRGGGQKKAKEAWLEFRDKLYDPSEPHNYKNGNRLRDYQVDGVNWLASMWYKRQGCILADEMGLGKTVQIVCYIEHIFRVEKIRRPFLVVVPLSTVEHWRREFEGWTDMVCCVYHDRQRVWRDVMREYEWYYEDRPHNSDFLKFDVLVTTYDTLIGDFDVISQIPFRVAVVDEAHRLRNQKGKLLECMREISVKGTMQFGFQSRVLMSGTPLQNDLTELWTLLNFIEPFKFPDLDVFQESFGNMANKGQVEALQSMISPYMLRRVKEDVAKDIPAKEETVIDVEMTSFQKQYYRAIFERNHAFLNFGATRNTSPKLMNIQMELRKVCNHPFLLDGVEHRETERQFKEYLENGNFDGKSPEQQQHMLNEHGYIMTSGKMVLLDKLLPKLKQEGHKILIFSQMVKMLDLISEYCEFREFKYERLDGRIRGSDRQKAIDRFEREADSFLFLLSTRAGGVGINLVSATVCILFDSDWNPQNDVQAQARCHRIGQTKDVRVYRLVTSRSFEQEMFDRASKKLGLEQAVLGTFEKEWEDDKPTQQEMEQLLKKGAYALLDDDNDEETKQFCADDIDSILAKRTRTRVVEGTKSASWLNKQGMVVSKSKFTSETGETLDMDDPLFWQKVMPDFVTPSILLQKLRELEDEIEGKVRGPGRGKGRWKKKNATNDGDPSDDIVESKEKTDDIGDKEIINDDANGSSAKNDDDEKSDDAEPGNASDAEDDESEDEVVIKKLSQTNKRKVNKFISDLKGLMESMFEDDDEEEALSSTEKDACQKLLLTVSVKDKIFNDEQRTIAKKFLKRLEGDRRRRCRTSDQPRFQPGDTIDDPIVSIREELMITGKKKVKKKRKGAEFDDELTPKKRRKSDTAGGYIGEDGYLHHSDSEDEWSDVGPDIYDPVAKKDTISRKDANRRRTWGVGDDTATVAGRAWPVFPRPLVQNVLTTIIDKVLKYDKQKGGVFSVPVPKDEFPEYYDQIKKPMDYGTMKTKIEDGEYRSAQSMQKDLVLIMQNCRTFNSDSSDIVREARAQHLMRPKFLKEAAAEHNLFLAEDGSVLEIVDENQGITKKKGMKKNTGEVADSSTGEEVKLKKVKVQKGEKKESLESVRDEEVLKKKSKLSKVKVNGDNADGQSSKDENSGNLKKPRIQIKLRINDKSIKKSDPKEKKKPSKRKRDNVDENEERSEDADVETEPILKKRKKENSQTKKKVHILGDKGSDLATQPSSVGAVDDAPVFFNLKFWKQCRESLSGTFKAARKNLTQFDGWMLPVEVADKFAEIANNTLEKMNKLDRYSVFEEKVTDKEAPGYSDLVLYPMDFGTMSEKVKNGTYEAEADAINALYKDFRQVFDNCYLYNDEDNEVTTEAIRVLSYLPETFVAACIEAKQRKK